MIEFLDDSGNVILARDVKASAAQSREASEAEDALKVERFAIDISAESTAAITDGTQSLSAQNGADVLDAAGTTALTAWTL